MKQTFFLLVFGVFLFGSCKKEENTLSSPPAVKNPTDAQIFALATGAGPWTYYKLSTDTLNRASGSGHTQEKLRTRYNSIAARQLDANGMVKSGAVFADSSLIVKELYSESQIQLYAVMMKMQSATNAGNGWLWVQYNPNGSVIYSVSNKGAMCTSCHSSGIDYTRMNDSHL